MARSNNKLVWVVGYLLIFVLSLDFWNWGKGTPLIAGMPFWVVFFFVLTLALSAYYWLFAKHVWGEGR